MGDSLSYPILHGRNRTEIAQSTETSYFCKEKRLRKRDSRASRCYLLALAV